MDKNVTNIYKFFAWLNYEFDVDVDITQNVISAKCTCNSFDIYFDGTKNLHIKTKYSEMDFVLHFLKMYSSFFKYTSFGTNFDNNDDFLDLKIDVTFA